MTGSKPSEPIQLYVFPASPPARAVWFTLKLLKLPFAVNIVKKGDHKKEPFTQINPYGLVPAITDGKVKLGESKAILQYLVEKYGGANNKLYPSDPATRAVVNMRLYWDAAQLMREQRNVVRPVIYAASPAKVDEAAEKAMLDDLKILDGVLAESAFVAGDCPTLADVSTAMTVISLEAVAFELAQVKNVQNWVKRMKEEVLPDYEDVSASGFNEHAAMLREKVGKN